MNIGDSLVNVTREVTSKDICQYADASGDFNPIHIDPAFATSTRYGGVIAHGMLSLAYVWEMMTLTFGDDWINGGKLKIRFRGPVFPGDLVSTSGVIKETHRDGGIMHCGIECKNQRGEYVITGDGWIDTK